MHIGFLAKSITFLGQIMVSDQLLPNSSRATKQVIWLDVHDLCAGGTNVLDRRLHCMAEVPSLAVKLQNDSALLGYRRVS
jgi:hypothetical protein